MESQLLKLNEIIKAIHQLFSNKKEEKKTYGEMSSVFLSLSIKIKQLFLKNFKNKMKNLNLLQKF